MPEVKIMKYVFHVLAIASFCHMYGSVYGQQVVATTGSHAGNSQGMLSWTVGELFISTLISEENVLTQGFHQGNLKVTVVTEKESLSFIVNFYPNPTHDLVFVNIEPQIPDNLHYVICSIQGQMLSKGPISGLITEISFRNMEPGTYIIRLFQIEETIKTVKVVKL